MRPSTGFIALVLLAVASSATGQVTLPPVKLSVDIGWGDRFRPGRWTPITITATSPRTRAVAVELFAPQGSSHGMRMRQFATLSSIPTTIQLYAPVRQGGSAGPTVTVRDAETGRTLARYPDADDYSLSQKVVDSSSRFVGVSGARTALQGLNGNISTTPINVAHMEESLLPEVAVGYDGLDLLVLNRPDLIHLDPAKQRAILDWVRAGGNLIFWPGDDPVPESSPLAGALPCRVEGPRDYAVTKVDAEAVNISVPPNFAGFRGRVLVPADGTEAIRLFGKAPAAAYAGRFGLGRIVVAPFDLGQVTYYGSGGGPAWAAVVKGMGILREEADPKNQGQNNGYGYGADPELQRQRWAIGVVQDNIGAVPGIGQFGFGYVALVLIGLMVIVGPVDWFVLRMLGRQPWTWVTTSGWIALVTLGALYVGHIFKSGDLHYRTVQVVDQVGDEAVGQANLAFIYAPRTTDYHLDAPRPPGEPAPAAGQPAPDPDPPAGWWQPASTDDYSGSGLNSDIDFHQSDRGNTPGVMPINVWNLRFLYGETPPGAPAVEAKLTYVLDSYGTTGRVVGTIRNLTDKPLIDVRVRTSSGFCVGKGGQDAARPLIGRIEPGAVAQIDAPIAAGSGLPDVPSVHNYGRYSPTSDPIPADLLWRAAGDLAGRRAQRADVLVATGAWACVYAECPDPDPVVALREPGALQKHYKFVRAVVPLAGGPGASVDKAKPE